MIKDLYIDGDHITYMCSFSADKKSGFEGDDEEEFEDFSEFSDDDTVELDITDDIQKFKDKVEEYEDIAMVECALRGWEFGKTHVIMSDVTNFRFRLTDTYKAKRTQNTEEFYALRDWAKGYYEFEDDVEADDVVSYYAKQGHMVFTTDKDVFKGNQGIFFNSHYMNMNWVETSKRSARRFTLLQTLMGDTVDNIIGIPKVGEKTAIKLLDKFGWCWSGVVKAYESNGLTESDAVLNRRLVDMNQWSPDGGVALWHGTQK